MKIPRLKISFTWDDWCFLWYTNEWPEYLAFGLGPIYIQITWRDEEDL